MITFEFIIELYPIFTLVSSSDASMFLLLSALMDAIVTHNDVKY